MQEEIDLILETSEEEMNQALDHLKKSLSKIRAGKASPDMLADIRVSYYGSLTPLNQVAKVNVTDATTLGIVPFEKNMMTTIEKAVLNANLGVTPANNGESVIINLPPLTNERRLELGKQVKREAENAKVSIRNARRDANDNIKQLEKDGLSKDDSKDVQDSIQQSTDEFIKKIDEINAQKNDEVMKV